MQLFYIYWFSELRRLLKQSKTPKATGWDHTQICVMQKSCHLILKRVYLLTEPSANYAKHLVLGYIF
jgi:hypothetical protein